jgi:hypothetical protein
METIRQRIARNADTIARLQKENEELLRADIAQGVADAAKDREALGITGTDDGNDQKQAPEHVPQDSVAQTLEDMAAAGLL